MAARENSDLWRERNHPALSDPRDIICHGEVSAFAKDPRRIRAVGDPRRIERGYFDVIFFIFPVKMNYHFSSFSLERLDAKSFNRTLIVL